MHRAPCPVLVYHDKKKANKVLGEVEGNHPRPNLTAFLSRAVRSEYMFLNSAPILSLDAPSKQLFRMVPGLEDMGMRILLNESETIVRGNQRIHLAGIDDAIYYCVDNIEKAAFSTRTMSSRSCCRTPRRSIARPLMPISVCCWLGTPTADRSVYQGPSYHPRFSPGGRSGKVKIGAVSGNQRGAGRWP